MPGRLRVTLNRSMAGRTQQVRGTIRALGLDRIGHTVEVPDSPATRGMVRAVRTLVTAEEVTAPPGPASAKSARARARRPTTSENET